MKKTLLILFSVFCITTINAQTTWNFSNWSLNSTGYSAETALNNLGIVPGVGTSNMAVIDSNNKTYNSVTYTQRLKLGGASWDTAASGPYVMPTKRYLYFDVTGPCTIEILAISSSSGASSTINITDGLNILNDSGSGTVTGTALGAVNATYSGSGGRIYIGAIPTQAANLYQIYVSTTVATLSVDSFVEKSSINVSTQGNQVNVSNIHEDSKIEVYNINGSLIKSINTSTDVNFQIDTAGFYIVNAISSKGVKSVKLIVN